VFADYERPVPPDTNLVEIFRSDAKMKYDISDYDQWGPLVSIEPYLKIWRETVGKQLEDEGKLTQFLRDFSEGSEIHKLILPYMKQEEDVLVFEPWMMM
jgi:hypothetical protein